MLYPHARFLLQPDLPAILQDLKRRRLVIGSVWGYYPGAGDGSTAAGVSFPFPRSTIDLAATTLGDSFGGMEMGEHDVSENSSPYTYLVGSIAIAAFCT